MIPRDAALEYLTRGWAPIPVPHGQKRPTLTGWQNLRITEETLDRYFDSRPRNVGVLLGGASGGLTDVDLDAPEALNLADCFLPTTTSIFGRSSKGRSHRLYVCTPIMPTMQFEDVDGMMLVELRSSGGQTLFPPSMADGDVRIWHLDEEPATIDGDDLRKRISHLAAASTLARHWPTEGSRHNASNALAGGLLRAGWTVDDVVDFVLVVARAAGDEEAAERASNVRTTARRLTQDRQATGWPTLVKLLTDGNRVVMRVRDWLGVDDGPEIRVGGSREERSAPTTDPPMPEPLTDHAFHGLIGDTVRAIAPGSEASPAAILAHCLSGFGALIGKNVRAMVGAAQHPARINTAIIGRTGKGRKGTAYRAVESAVLLADPAFAARVTEGLSSGEGLIWQVRDPIYRREKVGKGRDATYEEVEADPGVEDKRLWTVESEFATVLRVMQRDGNTLTAIMRRAWDRDDLKTLTKNNPAVATGAHIAITGHISRNELLRYLDRTELANGLINRFLFFASERAQLMPDGEIVDEDEIAAIAARLAVVREWAIQPRVLVRDDDAAEMWRAAYGALTADRPGMFGEATSRAEAQVLRLSVLYSALDCSELIRAKHLLAALGIWRYCEDSAQWVFGDATGDPVADAILAALRRSPLARTDISELLGRHVQRTRIDQALGLLLTAGLARRERESTRGRDREVWYAV